MPFSQSTMYPISNPGSRQSNRGYMYASADELATVVTAGYFAPSDRLPLQAGDFVFAYLGDGSKLLAMVSATAAEEVLGAAAP